MKENNSYDETEDEQTEDEQTEDEEIEKINTKMDMANYKRQVISEKMKLYLNNWIMIRVWSPKGTLDTKYSNTALIKNLLTGGQVGHASIQTSKNHISIWPEKRPTIRATLLHTGTPKYMNTLFDDLKDESRVADFCVVLHTLDASIVDKAFETLDTNLRYDLLGSKKTGGYGQNCSGLVIKLIALASANIEEKLKHTYKLLETPDFEKIIYDESKIYTPNDVAHLATKLKLQELNFLKYIGTTHQEIEALDMIESEHFLGSEISFTSKTEAYFADKIKKNAQILMQPDASFSLDVRNTLFSPQKVSEQLVNKSSSTITVTMTQKEKEEYDKYLSSKTIEGKNKKSKCIII